MQDIFFNLSEIIDLTQKQMKLHREMRFALKLQEIKNENPIATTVNYVYRTKGHKKLVVEEHFVFNDAEAHRIMNQNHHWKYNGTIKRYKLPDKVKKIHLRTKNRALDDATRTRLKQRLLQVETKVVDSDISSLEYILENGCVGYNYYTDARLVEEYENFCCQDNPDDEMLNEAKAQLAIHNMLED